MAIILSQSARTLLHIDACHDARLTGLELDSFSCFPFLPFILHIFMRRVSDIAELYVTSGPPAARNWHPDHPDIGDSRKVGVEVL